MPSRRAATLTPSPKRSSPSTITSPRLTPTRNTMRRSAGSAHRVDHARELGEDAVAGGLEDAAADLGHRRVGDLLAHPLQARERAFLVGAHHAAEADDVGGEDRRKSSLRGRLLHQRHSKVFQRIIWPVEIEKEQLFSRLAEGHAARITVVTPNRRLPQPLVSAFDSYHPNHDKPLWEAADILPFRAFVERLYEDALYSDIAVELPMLLAPAQERLLWQ